MGNRTHTVAGIPSPTQRYKLRPHTSARAEGNWSGQGESNSLNKIGNLARNPSRTSRKISSLFWAPTLQIVLPQWKVGIDKLVENIGIEPIHPLCKRGVSPS